MLNCRTQNKEPNIGSAFQRLKLQLIRERGEGEGVKKGKGKEEIEKGGRD